jgi:dTDP-4-amino-4,6-dideoxygalactose transaminase
MGDLLPEDHLFGELFPRQGMNTQGLLETIPQTDPRAGYLAQRAVGAGDLVSHGVTERAAAQILSLPIYPQLSDDAVERVIDEICRFFTLP